MRRTVLFTLLAGLTACSSPTITSESLSQSEINDILARVAEHHPDLSTRKQHEVTQLVVRALDNMVFIEGGTFIMGDFGMPCEPGSTQMCQIDYDTDNNHLHEVTLSDFAMAKYETTIGEFDLYREVIGEEPFAADLRGRERLKGDFEPDLPAWTRTWTEAHEYCQWLGTLSGRNIDLPTEAQWEYVSRNRGQKVLYATDNGNIEPGRNYPAPDEDVLPVGSYPPNPLGIYDLAANAGEWMRDWYAADYYQESPKLNPEGPRSGTEKVYRGLSTGNTPKSNTTVIRGPAPVSSRYYSPVRGFRCSASH